MGRQLTCPAKRSGDRCGSRDLYVTARYTTRRGKLTARVVCFDCAHRWQSSSETVRALPTTEERKAKRLADDALRERHARSLEATGERDE